MRRPIRPIRSVLGGPTRPSAFVFSFPFVSDAGPRVEVPHDKVLKLDCLVNATATDVNVTWTKDGYDLNCSRRSRVFAVHTDVIKVIAFSD